MEKNEILVIYGTDYIGMTKEILEEASQRYVYSMVTVLLAEPGCKRDSQM